jgi:hypothetical protein
VLLQWLKYLSSKNWSFSNLASLLRLNLFSYRDLIDWLNNPYDTPPLVPIPQQLALEMPGLGQPARAPRR